jgi:predicted metal-binding membrane protein
VLVRNTLHTNVLLVLLGGLIVLSWATLWMLDQSAAGALFHAHAAGHQHGHVTGRFGSGALFMGGWVLMTMAMMLPSTLPLVAIFHRFVCARPHASMLVALLLLGYLIAWALFGLAAWLLNAGIAAIPAATAATSSWIAAAGLCLLAGAFQFSKLKYQCLDRCRAPFSFVMSRWRGRNPRGEALQIGLAHGAFCVGCCWALMLLMFAVSTASLLWMLLLGLIMSVEKNVPWGRHFAKPLGWIIIAVGAGSVLYHVTMTTG